MIAVAQVEAGILCRKSVRGDGRILDVVGIGIVRNLIVILAQRSYEAQLVRRVEVENERSEAAVAIFGVVNRLWNRRLNSEIAAVGVDAGVIGEALGVAA